MQLAAAADGMSAIEWHGVGVFTEALASALRDPDAGQWTYGQLADRIAPVVNRRTAQRTYAYGALHRTVFGGTAGPVLVSWQVTEVIDKQVMLKGPLLPGFGPQAELRVFGYAKDALANNPAQSKATIVIDDFTGLNATARVIQRPPSGGEIKAGDFAVLARPGANAVKVTATLRPAGRIRISNGIFASPHAAVDCSTAWREGAAWTGG